MLDRFQSRFLTPTLFAFSDRNSVRFRFRFSRWFLRLFHDRFGEQLLQYVVAESSAVAVSSTVALSVAVVAAAEAVAVAQAVVLLQRLQLAVPATNL